jgi:hypothetical protein
MLCAHGQTPFDNLACFSLMDWQQTAALIVTGLAVAYLGWRTYGRLAGDKVGGCGTCADCGVPKSDGVRQTRPLVPLDTLETSAKTSATKGDAD